MVAQDDERGAESSQQRRRVVRVRADLRVVIARRTGDKRPARVVDVSLGGMYLEGEQVPEYGEGITVIVKLRETADWHLIPATVRWFSGCGFGVAFERLDGPQADALARFIDQAAA